MTTKQRIAESRTRQIREYNEHLIELLCPVGVTNTSWRMMTSYEKVLLLARIKAGLA